MDLGKQVLATSRWKDGERPKVSVWMVSYNQEAYIAKALDSILMQETTFPVEIIIGDDQSQDATRSIILKYQKKYPSLFRLLFHEKNLGPNRNSLEVLKACKGEYIAMLEADDFWTDPQKLQRQVTFLDSHPEATFCCHDFGVLYEDGKYTIPRVGRRRWKPNRFVSSEGLLLGPFVASTLTICFRNAISWPNWFVEFPYGDKVIEKLLSLQGGGYMLPQEMACYRVHKGGLTQSDRWKSQSNEGYKWHVRMLEYLLKEKVDGPNAKTLKLAIRFWSLFSQQKDQAWFRRQLTSLRYAKLFWRYAWLRTHSFRKTIVFLFVHNLLLLGLTKGYYFLHSRWIMGKI